MSNELLIQQI